MNKEDFEKNVENWKTDIEIGLNKVQDAVLKYVSGNIDQADYKEEIINQKERMTNIIDHMAQVNPPEFREVDYLNLNDGVIFLNNAFSSFEMETGQPAGQMMKLELKEAKDYFGEKLSGKIQNIINAMPDRP